VLAVGALGGAFEAGGDQGATLLEAEVAAQDVEADHDIIRISVVRVAAA
jgi:hypothetical protein